MLLSDIWLSLVNFTSAFLFMKYESWDSHRTDCGRSVGSPSEAETTLNNRGVDQFLRAIQSLDYYSRHTLVPIWTSVPLHQMIVEERLVRLHAVIDCLGLISQGGASDGPICHARVKLRDGLWSSASWKGTVCYLPLFSRSLLQYHLGSFTADFITCGSNGL